MRERLGAEDKCHAPPHQDSIQMSNVLYQEWTCEAADTDNISIPTTSLFGE